MERNVTLDYFKILFSILIITIHLYYPYEAGLLNLRWYIPEGIARIGVPFFFLVNGYYFARKINDAKAIKKYLVHLLIIYTTWYIIYLRPQILRVEQVDIINDLRIDILLEKYFWGIFHLWYLPALFFGILILVFLKKIIKKNSIILTLSLILFLVGYILQSMDTDYIVFRNGLFFGFPFIAIGYCIKSFDIKKIKNLHLIVLFILLLSTLFIESTYAKETFCRKDLYLSLIFLAPVLFVLILKHSSYKSPNRYNEYLGSLSSAIYFSHMYIIFKSDTIFGGISIVEKFLIVTFMSILVSIFIIFINKRIKIFL